MLKGQNLIYFAPGQWDGLWRNRHQLMSIFARQNKVLWVERRPHLRWVVNGLRTGELKPSEMHASLRCISDNLYVFGYPAWAAVSVRAPFRQITQAARRRSIQKAMRALHMRASDNTASAPIVWFSHPRMVDLLDEIPPAGLLLYHVVDEYTAYSGVTPDRRKWLEEREREMAARVDAVVVVSKKLYEAKRPLNKNTVLVPNGVDYQAYSAALADPQLPTELSVIETPRLGYSGLIGDRLDLQMLRTLAEGHPKWSLVFLGETRVEQQAEVWQALLALPNVHYLGQVDVSQVPNYLKGFQVGLMPYRLGRESDNISPLKLYDYMATGLPVASMDIPAAREFSAYIHLASETEDFAEAISAALADTTPSRRHERRQVASQHTWETRVEQLSDLIQTHLQTRNPLPGPAARRWNQARETSPTSIEK
jgi:glycosyltransferase involved in cell wall biosynthesis